MFSSLAAPEEFGSTGMRKLWHAVSVRDPESYGVERVTIHIGRCPRIAINAWGVIRPLSAEPRSGTRAIVADVICRRREPMTAATLFSLTIRFRVNRIPLR